MARILLGVSGGIAAYKALELARLATLAGHGVRVLMTPAASASSAPASFEGIVGAPVLSRRVRARPDARRLPGRPRPTTTRSATSRWRQRRRLPGRPASANTIAKLAAGICDSMLTTSFLACTAPRARGAGDERPHVRRRRHPGEPGAAARARGDGDRARARRARLARRARRRAGCPTPSRCWPRSRRCCPGRGAWDGLRVLVTAGGTREPIDPVRFIGNRSSGRMGLALAAAAARGAPR